MTFVGEIASDMWSDGWLGRTLLVILVALLAFILVALVAFTHWAVNYAFVPWEPDTGVVREVEYEAPHTTFIWVGKVLVPQFHPAQWHTLVESDRGREAVWATAESALNTGDRVSFWKRRGRYNGELEGSY